MNIDLTIIVKWYGEQFNVGLAAKEGAEPFLDIKGWRIANGSKGEFVSGPATKKEDGTWWRHVYTNEKFNAAVLAAAKKARGDSKPAKPARPADDDDDSIPF